MARQKFPSDEHRYTVAFPEALKDHIKAAAMVNNRSMNAEIVTRLQASFANAQGGRETVPITCSQCGAVCSQPIVHPGTVIRAFIQCPECTQKEQHQ